MPASSTNTPVTAATATTAASVTTDTEKEVVEDDTMYEVPVSLNPIYAQFKDLDSDAKPGKTNVSGTPQEKAAAKGARKHTLPDDQPALHSAKYQKQAAALILSTPPRSKSNALDTTMMIATPQDTSSDSAEKSQPTVTRKGCRVWLEGQSWYLGGMTREEVKWWAGSLQLRGPIGGFMLRIPESKPQCYGRYLVQHGCICPWPLKGLFGTYSSKNCDIQMCVANDRSR